MAYAASLWHSGLQPFRKLEMRTQDTLSLNVNVREAPRNLSICDSFKAVNK